MLASLSITTRGDGNHPMTIQVYRGAGKIAARASEILGETIPEYLIYQWVDRGKLRASRFGRNLTITNDQLIEDLTGQRPTTASF